jgi:hypothetical protein
MLTPAEADEMENKDEVIRHLIEHRRKLQAKRDNLVQGIDVEIDHVTATIASLQKSGNVELYVPTASLSLADFNVAKLRGLTQVQAVVSIATANNGIVRAQDAKHMLIKAGVMRSTKNSNTVIHAVIKRSGRFERVGVGTYQLKNFGNGKTAESEGPKLFKQLTQ